MTLTLLTYSVYKRLVLFVAYFSHFVQIPYLILCSKCKILDVSRLLFYLPCSDIFIVLVCVQELDLIKRYQCQVHLLTL